MSIPLFVRRAIALALTLSLVLSLLACDGGVNDGEICFTDSLGREVRLDERPERVAVLFSSLAQAWSLAGGNISVGVGECVTRGICDADTPLVHADSGGAGKSINLELLLACKPQLVICTADYPGQLEICSTLEKAGVAVAYFRLESFEDYLFVLKTMTDLTESPDAYREYGERVAEQISAILSGATNGGYKILFTRATKNSLKAKLPADHFAAAMLSELGTHNIAEDLPILLDGVSVEHIISENPDYIFISLMGDEQAAVSYVESLFSTPAFLELDAVKNKKYFFLPKELFQYKPCERWAEAYRVLWEYLYE